jgi:hypothetical protein
MRTKEENQAANKRRGILLILADTLRQKRKAHTIKDFEDIRKAMEGKHMTSYLGKKKLYRSLDGKDIKKEAPSVEASETFWKKKLVNKN